MFRIHNFSTPFNKSQRAFPDGALLLHGFPFALVLETGELAIKLPDVEVSSHFLLGCLGNFPPKGTPILGTPIKTCTFPFAHCFNALFQETSFQNIWKIHERDNNSTLSSGGSPKKFSHFAAKVENCSI